MTAHIARALLRGYLRLVGAYLDRHTCAWANDTAEDD